VSAGDERGEEGGGKEKGRKRESMSPTVRAGKGVSAVRSPGPGGDDGKGRKRKSGKKKKGIILMARPPNKRQHLYCRRAVSEGGGGRGKKREGKRGPLSKHSRSVLDSFSLVSSKKKRKKKGFLVVPVNIASKRFNCKQEEGKEGLGDFFEVSYRFAEKKGRATGNMPSSFTRHGEEKERKGGEKVFVTCFFFWSPKDGGGRGKRKKGSTFPKAERLFF